MESTTTYCSITIAAPVAAQQEGLVAIDINAENQRVDQEIDNKFQCYSCIIYIYLVLTSLETLGGLVTVISMPTLSSVFSLLITIGMFYIWCVGLQSHNAKDAGLQLRFQGLLIPFIGYYIVICGLIISESYSTIPYLTMVSFTLNILYGILTPVVMYYSANDLRKVMEEKIVASN